MTDSEKKIFDNLRGDGWFEGIGEPLGFAIYDLSRNVYPQEKSKSGKKKSLRGLFKRKLKPAPTPPGTANGLRTCRGVALVYPDVITLWEERRQIESISYSHEDDIKAEICDGCVVLKVGDRVVCTSRMAGKTKYYTLVKRLNAVKEGKDPSKIKDDLSNVCIKCGKPLEGSSDDKLCFRCKSKKPYIKRLWDITKGSRAFLMISVFMFFAVTAVNMILPRLNKELVDVYIKPQYSYLKGFLIIIAAIFTVNMASRLLSIFRSRVLIRASNGVIVKLREMTFAKVQKMSVSNVSKRTAGNLMHRITRDTQMIQSFITSELPSLIEQVLMFLGIGTILFIYDWRLALLVLIPMPFVVVIHRMFWSRVRIKYDLQWNKESTVETFLHDIFSGIRVVKSFGTEARENKRFDKLVKDECDTQVKNETFFAIYSPLITFFIGAGEIMLLYYVGYNNLRGTMSLGDMTMFTSYVGMIYGPLAYFGRLLRQVTRTLNSVAKVFEILDEKIDVADSDKAVEQRIQGYIDIDNVSFDYDERNSVLHNINLHVKPGEMIGIVGKSGVGKSTLINLVMRMYDVDEGSIRIDGVDIRDYSQESLRSQIGAVLQETFLFSGSIYNNIAYAKPDATRDEVINAAKLAGAHGFIAKLPDAYNTYVGERGYTLSGGERQRITIARALLHNPRILILDEATSSLDTETEKQIQDALQVLIKDRTTLAIAHRLSTLRNATRLIVLDDGKVAEEGTHEELMMKKGLYYDLVMAQRQMSSLKKNSPEAGA